MSVYAHVSFYRGHRITVESNGKAGFSVKVESASLNETYGIFAHDYDAHGAAVEAIDDLLGSIKPAVKLVQRRTEKRMAKTDRQPEPTDKGVEFFGKRFLWARSRARMAIPNVAKRTGLTAQQVRFFEKGQAFPIWGEAKKIAEAIDCDAKWLMTGEGESQMIWAKGK